MSSSESTYRLYGHEDEYPALDAEGACARLAKALTFRTVSGKRAGRSAFSALQDHIRASYPLIMERSSFEVFGQSVLITLPGSDAALDPVILLAHQDVVFADESAWSHPPFSGYMDDAYIWGRGALDIKGMMFAELEAVELALLEGLEPRRSLIFAFGEDEEIISEGAIRLASVLKGRGVRAALLLDEGTTTHMDGSAFGAEGTYVQGLCLSQKGFLTVRLHAAGFGGHSSNPFGATSLEKICAAVQSIRNALPAPHFTELMLGALEELGVVADDMLLERLANTEESFPYVADTMAVTQIEGSSPSENILPYDATATINFRLLPGHDIEAFLDCIRAAAGDGIEVELVHATPAARVDAPSGELYEMLKGAFSHCYPGVSFVPLCMRGGCDAIRYEAVSRQSVRVLPFLVPPEDERRIHAVDERISKRSYLHAIRMLRRFIGAACFT